MLLLALLILSVLLARSLLVVNRQGSFKQHRPLNQLLFGRQKGVAVPPADVNYIDSWMTFKYLNTIFNLPENYLKDSLNISDKRYPNIPLGKYASANKINGQAFMAEVKKIIKAYPGAVIK